MCTLGDLRELLNFDDIVIQCHNAPDADTIASGFAIQEYLKHHGKQAEIVYGGTVGIQKSGTLLMLESLGIKINKLEKSFNKPVDLLITVDCQPGESNVDWIDCNNLVIIDHHEPCEEEQYRDKNIVLKVIDDTYTACSSIIWHMLKQVGFEIVANSPLATALYYGLYTDSNKFQTGLSHGDEDLRVNIQYDRKMIRRFQGSNISQLDLEIMIKALSSYRHNPTYYYAISEAQYCDPNILGITSDTLIEVNIVDVCIVFCIRDDIIKLSIRSCTDEIHANDLVEYVVNGIPNSDGGGTETKAGGKISIADFIKTYNYGNLTENQFKSKVMEHLYDITSAYFSLNN